MYVDTQVRPQGELVDAVAPAKLKLSAAIRIGAKIRPQCSGFAFAEGGSCVLGAAYEGLYGKPWPEDDYINFPASFIRIMFGYRQSISELMMRNDRGESRESIADWLEAQGL